MADPLYSAEVLESCWLQRTFSYNRPTSVAIAAVTLAIIAGAYFGFAVADGRVRVIAVEVFSCLLFGSAATVGLLWSPVVIPLAILAHGLWVVGHALPWIKSAVPHGYPTFCLSADFAFGGPLMVLYLS